MDWNWFFLGLYLFLQLHIIYSSRILLDWIDAVFKRDYAKAALLDIKSFCIRWIIVTPLVIFLDVGLLYEGTIIAQHTDWMRVIAASPIFFVIFLSTYTKTQFIQLCWNTLQLTNGTRS